MPGYGHFPTKGLYPQGVHEDFSEHGVHVFNSSHVYEIVARIFVSSGIHFESKDLLNGFYCLWW